MDLTDDLTFYHIGHRWKGLFTVEEEIAGAEFGITLSSSPWLVSFS